MDSCNNDLNPRKRDRPEDTEDDTAASGPLLYEDNRVGELINNALSNQIRQNVLWTQALTARAQAELLNNATAAPRETTTGSFNLSGFSGMSSFPYQVSQRTVLQGNSGPLYNAAAATNTVLQAARAQNVPPPVAHLLDPVASLQGRLMIAGAGSTLFGGGALTSGMRQQLLLSALAMPPSQTRSFNLGMSPLGNHQGGQATDVHPGALAPLTTPSVTSFTPSATSLSADLLSQIADNDGREIKLLYTPADDTKLSPYQCLARKQIEIFSATKKDLEAGAQGRNRPISLHQVGIRCRWCATLPSRQKHRASAYYPSQLGGIYQAAQNITNSHISRLCQCVPEEIRRELQNLQMKKSGAGGGKKYWSESAKAQGIYDYEGGGLRLLESPSEETSNVYGTAGVEASDKAGTDASRKRDQTPAMTSDKEDKAT